MAIELQVYGHSWAVVSGEMSAELRHATKDGEYVEVKGRKVWRSNGHNWIIDPHFSSARDSIDSFLFGAPRPLPEATTL